jgi:hypothetical protein
LGSLYMTNQIPFTVLCRAGVAPRVYLFLQRV